MSLVKFTNRQIHRGKRIHWGRASEDGLPFRGAAPPMYTAEEFEQRTVKVGDPRAEIFDLSDPDQKQNYLEVLDGIVNGWFQCLHRKRFVSRKDPTKAFVHIEWVEFFMEDGHPTPFLSPGTMELANGFSIPQ